MAKRRPIQTATKPPGRGPRRIHWGTVEDVVRLDQERNAAVAKDTEAFTRLLDRSLRAASSSLRTRITPWLLIRYSSTDRGARPIPSNQAFWESPDIRVDSDDPSGNPVAGKPNFVHARILNLGAFDAVPVKVDFFWGDPSLGLNAAHMHLIGTEYVAVPSMRSVDVRCQTPWIPVFENQGHECLMVNCGNWVADPLINAFEPVLDRHVGQRNLTVIAASPGMLIAIGLRLGNLFPADVAVNVVANIAHLTVDKALLQKASLPEIVAKVVAFDPGQQKDRAIALVARKYDAPFLEAQLSGQSRFFNLSSACLTSDSTEVRSSTLQTQRCAMTVLSSKLHAGEQRGLDVRIGVPQSARPGDFIVCRLAQVVRNQPLGGYTIVIRLIES